MLTSKFFSFIWDKKPDKICRKDIIKPLKLGGLDMVQVDVFWNALKFSWYRRLITSNDIWPKILLAELSANNVTSTDQILFAGPSELKSWGKTIKNPFWSEVLSIGADMITEMSYAKPEQFTLFPLLNNPLFKIGNRTLSVERLGIANRTYFQIADLMHPETNTLFTAEGFREFHNSNITTRSYNAIANSVERALAKLNIHWGLVEPHSAPRQSILIAVACRSEKGCSQYYKILMCRKIQSRDTSKQEAKWHAELGCTLSVNFWDSSQHFVANIKNNNDQKYFQYQIVRGMLKTNTVVTHFVALVPETCSFGCQMRETISHLFWQCQISSNFWTELTHYVTRTLRMPFELTKLNILFGEHNETVSSVKNVLILTGKKYIWLCKFRQLRPTLLNFTKYLLQHLATLKMISCIKNSEPVFNDQWGYIVVSLTAYVADHEIPATPPPSP